MRVLSIRQVMHTFHLLYYLMAFRQIYKGKMICREIRRLPKQLKKVHGDTNRIMDAYSITSMLTPERLFGVSVGCFTFIMIPPLRLYGNKQIVHHSHGADMV